MNALMDWRRKARHLRALRIRLAISSPVSVGHLLIVLIGIRRVAGKCVESVDCDDDDQRVREDDDTPECGADCLDGRLHKSPFDPKSIGGTSTISAQ